MPFYAFDPADFFERLPDLARVNGQNALAEIKRATDLAKTDPDLAREFVEQGAAHLTENAAYYGGPLSLALLEGLLEASADVKDLRLTAVGAGCDIIPDAIRTWAEWNTVKLLQDVITSAGDNIAEAHVYKDIYISGANPAGEQSFFLRVDPEDPQSSIHVVSGAFEGTGLQAHFRRAGIKPLSPNDVDLARTALAPDVVMPTIKDTLTRKIWMKT